MRAGQDSASLAPGWPSPCLRPDAATCRSAGRGPRPARVPARLGRARRGPGAHGGEAVSVRHHARPARRDPAGGHARATVNADGDTFELVVYVTRSRRFAARSPMGRTRRRRSAASVSHDPRRRGGRAPSDLRRPTGDGGRRTCAAAPRRARRSLQARDAGRANRGCGLGAAQRSQVQALLQRPSGERRAAGQRVEHRGFDRPEFIRIG
jgi:hypothetical protein